MSICVVGTGSIGSTLAACWQRAGMPVVLTDRSTTAATQENGLSKLPLPQALQAADIVVTAVPGAATAGFLEQHRHTLADRIVVDPSNRIGPGPMHSAEYAEGVRYFRAFNTVGVENFADPVFGANRADLFFSGPESGKESVEELIEAVGMRPVWVGDGVEAADLLDGLTRLWFRLALQRKHGRHIAFRMLP